MNIGRFRIRKGETEWLTIGASAYLYGTPAYILINGKVFKTRLFYNEERTFWRFIGAM